MPEDDREKLFLDFCGNMGAMVAEIAMAWFASEKRLRSLFEVQGVEHLEQALEHGKGVILSTGHFTTLEIATPIIKDYVPWYTLVYNKRRSRLLSEFQRRYRQRFAHELYPKGDVRPIIRSLRRNGVVWYAADEAFLEKSSAVVPFFGKPAVTSTLISRLARISGAAVVPLFFYRKPDESGYLIRFSAALEDFPTEDVVADTQRLTGVLESAIRQCPAQYFWNQRRFRGVDQADSSEFVELSDGTNR